MGSRRAKKVHVFDDIHMKSGFEVMLAQQMAEAGVDFEYEGKVLTFVIPARTAKYVPDFHLGNGIIIEGKGIWDLDDRKKIASVREQNPELDIRMVFQRDHALNKGAKMRYSEWCEKRGIPYAIGKIPEEWLEQARTKPRKPRVSRVKKA